ncbi:hypothetical protein CSC3H3_06005 [Thalassospira marina]|uniref:Uncharacterized protein n=1 Tax=Thalassospira marina TaxID=2048283 RepID=A0ABM6Q731_9PROT|nr:hypothetical protein CSC3H3_06005 [Thalassospira marina]
MFVPNADLHPTPTKAAFGKILPQPVANGKSQSCHDIGAATPKMPDLQENRAQGHLPATIRSVNSFTPAQPPDTQMQAKPGGNAHDMI